VASYTATAIAETFGDDLQPAAIPLWRESLFALDWWALRSAPVYYGCGVEHGNGEPVVVVPGFLASDASLMELYGWLARIGYRPYFSRIGCNADCPNQVALLLRDTIARVHAETGERVKVVGHSLGGMLARSVAREHPEMVERVISMGSPLRDGDHAHPLVIAATESLRSGAGGGMGRNIKASCFSGHCTCAFGRSINAPAGERAGHFAIYSRSDGVVDWRSCMEADPALNDEVDSTHLGMAFHPGVYRALARRLAQAL
jgi:pimeloyl-ACP methyl ester carboxylesterase